MCPTDVDLDLDLPEIAKDEQAPSPDPHLMGRYVGVARGLAERQDGPDAAPAGLAARSGQQARPG
jgi:hypothetical protein